MSYQFTFFTFYISENLACDVLIFFWLITVEQLKRMQTDFEDFSIYLGQQNTGTDEVFLIDPLLQGILYFANVEHFLRIV